MGFLTNLLNPKIAVFYLSIFPQFIDPASGSVFAQGVLLGVTQIAVSFSVNLLIVLSAAGVSRWFGRNPLWFALQRYLMGCVLAGLALRLAAEQRRARLDEWEGSNEIEPVARRVAPPAGGYAGGVDRCAGGVGAE